MFATTRRSFLLSAPTLTLGAPLAARVQGAPGPSAFARRAPVAGARDFFRAVERGDAAAVERMLAERPELLGAGDDAGRSALAVALLAGHEPVARVLMEAGFEPDLVEAAMIPDWDLVQERCEAAPGLLDAYHPAGGTALWAAARTGRRQLWRLQSMGADPDGNPLGRRGTTPAGGALACPDAIGAMSATVSLLSNAASVHARQRGGNSLLHLAVRRGDDYLVRYVIRRGADVGARNDAGETALELAERLELEGVARTLRAHEEIPRDHVRLRYAYDAGGAPVELDDLWDVPRARQGEVTGASHNDLETVRGLLDEDPRLVFSFSSQDELAIEACGHTGNRDIMALHLDHGAPQSLATSISIGDLGRAAALLEEDPALVHERGPHDFAMMWYPAIGGGSVAAAELLLAHGAPVDQESQHTSGLHQAAMRGHADLARFLVERGANPGAAGHYFEAAGETPRQVALARGHEGLARMLAQLGG